ncbi:multiubiquitin domain-containing protein [Methylomonas sp. BW4-1]|uniref:multiubiquitin domain-containing protein n=1 Tax=Methylomonas sp. BW4-1 TaxID=3376685 RepID=UPI004042525A
MQTNTFAGDSRIPAEDVGTVICRTIDIADQTLNYRQVNIDDFTPTGAQLAIIAGFKSVDGVSVLQVLTNGDLEDVRPNETVDLRREDGRFVIVESDRSYRLTIDGQRFDWPCHIVSGGLLRKLGQVPTEKAIYFERQDQLDCQVDDQDLVDLDAVGVESFVSRKLVWKLNVQGVVLELFAPTIVVREALVEAGFNPDQGWHIFLKIVGQQKQQVELSTVIDLRTPGIEKLRLTPKDVNNGEAPVVPCRTFSLLDVDEAHLNRLGLKWETLVEAERRWLLLHDYPLPVGYTVSHSKVALEIPPTYPGAQIYGFYVHPPLALSSGRVIASTQLRGTLLGVEFHGWSRNRGPAAPWDANTDNVMTQLTLVDAALAKEVGE